MVARGAYRRSCQHPHCLQRRRHDGAVLAEYHRHGRWESRVRLIACIHRFCFQHPQHSMQSVRGLAGPGSMLVLQGIGLSRCVRNMMRSHSRVFLALDIHSGQSSSPPTMYGLPGCKASGSSIRNSMLLYSIASLMEVPVIRAAQPGVSSFRGTSVSATCSACTFH